MNSHVTWVVIGLVLLCAPPGGPDPDHDRRTVGDLDIQYQAAVRNHDAVTMNRILADEFVLVTGRGSVFSRADLLNEAADTAIVYERQEDTSRTVRLWGSTAVLTALLWAKGTDHGKPFDYKLWFSDTYVRTPSGWRYAFGQSSLRLPTEP